MKTFLKILFSLIFILFLVGIGFYILFPLLNVENGKVSEKILFNRDNKSVGNEKEETPKNDNKFSFIVLSDSNAGGGSVAQPQSFQNIIQEIANSSGKPDFVIHNGDMIAGTSRTSKSLALQMWDEFEKVAISPLHENNIGFFHSAGNHDASFNSVLPQVYEEFWGKYENVKDYNIEGSYNNYYSLIYNSCYFIILYGSKINISEKQLSWLESEINKSSEYKNIFVFSHVPLTAASNYHPSDQLSPSSEIKNILRGKITAFFGAHHNVYYDVELDGIRQIGVGRAGSGGAYQLKPELGGGLQDYLSYVEVKVDGSDFEVKQIIK